MVVFIQNYICSYSYCKGDKFIFVVGYLEVLFRFKGGGILECLFDIWMGFVINFICEDCGIFGLDSDRGQWLEN